MESPSDETPSDGVLDYPGLFRVAVPPGWSASAIPGHRYDLRHDELDVAVTISVARDVVARAEAMAAAFARDRHATSAPDVATRAAEDHVRAFARFEAEGRMWAVMVLRHGSVAVLASAESAVGDEPAAEAGERVVGSLAPAPVRRRLRRWGV
jgi:hypothetical protein